MYAAPFEPGQAMYQTQRVMPIPFRLVYNFLEEEERTPLDASLLIYTCLTDGPLTRSFKIYDSRFPASVSPRSGTGSLVQPYR